MQKSLMEACGLVGAVCAALSVLFAAMTPVLSQGTVRAGTQYLTFWSGDLRIIAAEERTEVRLVDVETGELLSLDHPQIDRVNVTSNPFVLDAAGDAFEGIGGIGGPNAELRVRIETSDADGGDNAKPVVVWTGSLGRGTRHPENPPGSGNPWMSYLPAAVEGDETVSAELGRSFLGFTSRDMIIIARPESTPTSIEIADLATNTDADSDDSVTLTPADADLSTSDIEVYRLEEFEDDTVRVSGNVDMTVLVGLNPEGSTDWTATPASYAAGDDGIERGTEFYAFVKNALTVLPLQDNTTVEITDLSDGDDTQTVTLPSGSIGSAYSFFTPTTDTRTGSGLLPRSADPAVTIIDNDGNPFDDDIVKVTSDKPILTYVGPIGSDTNEFADVAYSVATGPDSRIVYAYAQNFGNSNDLQVFAFTPDAEVTITSLSTTRGFVGNNFNDFEIGPGFGSGGWLEGTADGDVWWGSGVWGGELLRIESTRPILVINGDYDARHFGAFVPFVSSARTLPPVAVIEPESQSADVGESVPFDGSGSFDQDDVEGPQTPRYEWDFDTATDSDGNGTPDDDVDATGEMATTSYDSSGSYTVKLTFFDDEGASDTDFATVEVAVSENEPPMCDAGGPYVAECAGSVTTLEIASESTDPEGEPLECLWSTDATGLTFADDTACATELDASSECASTREIDLRVTDPEDAFSECAATVEIQDTRAPELSVITPEPGSCSQGPVEIVASAADVCDPAPAISVEPPGPFADHGDHVVEVGGTDCSDNSTSTDVAFTVDTVPPEVELLAPRYGLSLPSSDPVPGSSLFAASDDDGATGGVEWERLLLNGCVLLDGNSFGDGDGSLRDEMISLDPATLCPALTACGFDVVVAPTLVIEAYDCAGNLGTAMRRWPRKSITLRPGICGSGAASSATSGFFLGR